MGVKNGCSSERHFFSGIWFGIGYHVKGLFIVEVFLCHLTVINVVK